MNPERGIKGQPADDRLQLNDIRGFMRSHLVECQAYFGYLFWHFDRMTSRMEIDEIEAHMMKVCDRGEHLKLTEEGRPGPTSDAEESARVFKSFLCLYLQIWRKSSDFVVASRFLADELMIETSRFIQARHLLELEPKPRPSGERTASPVRRGGLNSSP